MDWGNTERSGETEHEYTKCNRQRIRLLYHIDMKSYPLPVRVLFVGLLSGSVLVMFIDLGMITEPESKPIP